MSKVILQGFILIPDEDLAVVIDELSIHEQLTHEESGCLMFEVTPDPDNPNRYTVYEEYVDDASFDAHQVRVKHSHWGEVTKNVERHYRIIRSSTLPEDPSE